MSPYGDNLFASRSVSYVTREDALINFSPTVWDPAFAVRRRAAKARHVKIGFGGFEARRVIAALQHATRSRYGGNSCRAALGARQDPSRSGARALGVARAL